jgi:hypothetical protein
VTALPLGPAAAQLTVDVVSPAVAVGAVGAVGKPAGTTLLLAVDGGPVPIALVAVTVKEWAVPLIRPVTVQLSIPVVVQTPSPGLALTR